MRITPISQPELIRRLRRLGWEGPIYGGSHPHMIKGPRTLHVPNPHGQDISAGLLKRILEKFEISREEWQQSD